MANLGRTLPVVTEEKARAIVAERSMRRCEIHLHGICQGAQRSVHHRLKRGRGHEWAPSNLLAACGDGTTGCHGYVEANPAWANEHGLWLMAGDGEPSEVSVWMRWANMRGWFVLDDEGMLELDGGLQVLVEPIVRELLSAVPF